MTEYVAILDAGSQFGKVIDRKVRELHVESRILPLDTSAAVLRDDPHLKAIIISGGPSSVYAADAPAYDPELFETGKPLLGICYGLQMMVKVFGGTIERKSVREDGQDDILFSDGVKCPLFEGLDSKAETVLLTHGDSIASVGEQLEVVAVSSAGIIAAAQHKSRPLYGVQFHPEVELTAHGPAMFRNFLAAAGCSFSFTMEDRELVAIRGIRERCANGQRVLCLASGGVDSTVCAVLLLKALGPERVICIHINHGFMRQNESEDVVAALRAAGVHVHLIDATEDFRNATTTIPAKGGRPAYESARLEVALAPEEKRHIIGDTFMRVCDRATRELGLDAERDSLLLAQGTLRPDLIESGSALASKKADAIKTHHNDTALVRQLRDGGRIIEPLSDYHKDEVRELGRSLGLPEALTMRQPFPGPGLAIRVLCVDAPFSDAHFDETEAALRSIASGQHDSPLVQALQCELHNLDLRAVLLPVRSVGVQGDGRTYAYVAAITAAATPMPSAAEWATLLALAKVVPKLLHNVNRVVFLFGGHVYNDCHRAVTPTSLTVDAVERIRVADAIVGRALIAHDLVRRLSQVPVVLVPLGFERGVGSHSIAIRTFLTSDFMTGVPAAPGGAQLSLDVLREMVDQLTQLPFVGRVMFDLTAKPPGTTEWE